MAACAGLQRQPAEGRADRRQIRFEEGRPSFPSSPWRCIAIQRPGAPIPTRSTPTISRARRRPSGPPNAWKPFGNGQRACIGRGFAMHEAALALGMILQRFKLIDHTRYQMVLKETLTIKPDGFKIKVRPRTDADRAKSPETAPTTAAATSGGFAPGRARPGHDTPLLVLYGSNLGTAEELATRVADLAAVNGFAARLAPLDEAAGKLPTEGGVLDLLRVVQRRAARQCRAIRQMARRRSRARRVRGRPLCALRLRQHRLGGDLSSDPPADRRSAFWTWRQARLCARRRQRARGSRRPIRGLVRKVASAGGQGTRHRDRLRRRKRRDAAIPHRTGRRRARRRLRSPPAAQRR